MAGSPARSGEITRVRAWRRWRVARCACVRRSASKTQPSDCSFCH